MTLFNLLLGAALLFFGRRLFWLFVAGVGFVVGAMLAAEWLGKEPEWLIILIALAAGVIGALVSVVLQKLVVAVAGFLAGGYVLYTLTLGLKYESLVWIAFFLGGVLGAVLVLVLFDWALILLSALIGATVIVQHLTLDRLASAVAFLVLCVLGIVVQARQLKPPAPAPEPGQT
jgi:hypothetical protein